MSNLLFDLALTVAQMPTWVGVVLIVGAVAVLAFLAGCALTSGRAHRDEPVESLLETQPWLAEEGEPVPAKLRPRPRHRYPVAIHPLHRPTATLSTAETDVLPRIEDVTATVPIRGAR